VSPLAKLQVDDLVVKPGWSSRGQPLQRPAVTPLFEQLAAGARLGIFARVEVPAGISTTDRPRRSRYLAIKRIVDRIPLRVEAHGHDGGGARVANDLQLPRGASGIAPFDNRPARPRPV